MSVITLTINGELCSARAGQTLLAVIREHAIVLPTLCQLDGIEAWGGCRLCVIELSTNPRPQPACTTYVQEGMVVTTDSEKLHTYRRMIVELLLAERNHTCAVCVSSGNCELQSVAAQLGIDHVRFDYLFPKLAMDTTHDRYGLDQNRCILCTRCVRVCRSVEGACTWDIGGRGFTSRLIADLDRPWGKSTSCTDCGKCVQLCPTGALFRRGATVAEMVKEKSFLKRILANRAHTGGRDE